MPPRHDDQTTRVALLVDGPASGAWNMAVDEALLVDAAESGRCWLRFYQWSEPTLSLGYFQHYDERRGHAASRGCPLVRRASGGGAIVHDAELTYLLALPASHPLAAHPPRLYTLVHEALLGALANWRISAELCCEPIRLGAAEPFLCFQRRSQGDVLLRVPRPSSSRTITRASESRHSGGILTGAENELTAKFCGSAQRRQRGALAQHGSLLLGRSICAPELDGLLELSGRALSAAELRAAWTSQMVSSLSFTFEAESMPETRMAQVRGLALEKYDTDSWNKRR